ncbi:MAG: hypothetical protein CMQ05_12015 [Gammaproteobacteria bacterium]|uniref:DUF4892 domain-containing protein n=1 Tax=OM182 bacterium MED-G24 TaxID=1986255 RepID=A0A2A5WJC8_9GAMM|nr:hypothetical protein [Gammaproteobacteria bacterium]PDH36531.1 MAG: hypothetical protein CNE99_09565 [OM182 bacterium MED-G24]RPG25108.1 MAG: DUF4892 domain-containing protein [Gammaproteobacteria bacterium TMED50]|tara:strand:- start:146 stop:1012 length:867 start_codon:yes stop_codon:yes gene_type:complete
MGDRLKKRTFVASRIGCLFIGFLHSGLALTDDAWRYPSAEVVSVSEDMTVASHELMLGAMRRNNTLVIPEDSRFAQGTRVATTYFIPSEQRPDVVASYYDSLLTRDGTVLFSCSGRSCGSSNDWANGVFGESILYGPDQDQRYFIAEDDDTIRMVYIGLRGTRKLYVNVTEINTGNAVGSFANLAEQLIHDGRYVVDESRLSVELDTIAEWTASQNAYRFAVVVHERKRRGETVREAVSRTTTKAEQLMTQLVDRGVSSTRIEAYGVGPLSPIDQATIDRVELVLISQ